MTFGEYIKRRRNILGLKQSEISEFSQAYISDIEAGAKRPTKRDTITSLAKSLQIPDDRVDWLLVYSLLDRDPSEVFGENQTINYQQFANEYEIQPGTSLNDIITVLGEPLQNLRFGLRRKLKYELATITFEDDKVIDVEL